MYEQFFNLRERPFKLVPNPDYLYFSPSHARALSHLQYASAHGDGFVLITGEVGTGKTTLSRCYLSGLGDGYESAYIFNTKIDTIQLLFAICHEFGINVSRDAGYQTLLNAFNQFLMVQHQADRTVVLLIDEAQNLTTENLEMVRLLSNLETTRHKLLHIVLVGQPELAEKLDTHALRQLSQRISLRCRLELLSRKQTQTFIKHRVMVAAKGPSDLFSTAACRLIHRYAQGIPRRINIAADRALLAAFELKQTKVRSATTAKALRELHADNKVPKNRKYLKAASYAAAGLLLGAALIAFVLNSETVGSAVRAWYSGSEQVGLVQSMENDPQPAAENQTFKIQPSARPPDPQPQAIILPEAAVSGTPAETEDQMAPFDPVVQAQTNAPPETQSLKETPTQNDAVSADEGFSFFKQIAELDPKTSRMDALSSLLALWQQPRPHPGQLPESMPDNQFFHIAALQYGLRLMIIENDWPLVQRLNLPAVVAIAPARDGETVFATLASWQDDRMRLIVGPGQLQGADPAVVRSLSTGPAYIFWYHNLGNDAVISRRDQGEDVVLVKKLLRKIGYPHLSLSSIFDPQTYHAIVDFQLSHGLEPDGLVGPMTKILLMAAADSAEIPHLDENKLKAESN